jgi:glutamate carboxypeptidase
VIRELHEWVRTHRDELLDDVATYVGIETPSDDKSALDRGLSWVDGWLRERLGSPDNVRDVDGGQYGDIKVYDFPGAGESVLLLAHYDTVWPLGTLAAWPFTVDGDRATGPGIFDMKSGLVHAVWALRALDAAGLPRPAVRLVLNGDEEIGSPASRPVIEEAAAGTRATLVFEASADGAVKTARKGVGLFRVRATGVEAHAGLDPAKGASAVDELARAVLALHGLSDPDAGTTVNVGVIAGGTRQNVIAGAAAGEIDVRVSSAAEAARIDAGLAALKAHDPRATVEAGDGTLRKHRAAVRAGPRRSGGTGRHAAGMLGRRRQRRQLRGGTGPRGAGRLRRGRRRRARAARAHQHRGDARTDGPGGRRPAPARRITALGLQPVVRG